MSSNSPHHTSEESAIERSTQDGKEITTIKPKGFNIVWGRDNRYWRVEPGAAELMQVSWFEVTGTTKLSPGKSYQIQFEVSMKQDAFGWSGCPVFMMAKIGKKGRYSWKKIGPLDQFPKEGDFRIPQEAFNIKVPAEGSETDLYFGLYEVWSGKWKGGLLIHNATIKEV